jgi:hypothetical protein
MRRSGRQATVWASLAGLAVLAAAVLAALAGRDAGAPGSSVSRGPAGWLAARKYLEARGTKVALWREPLDRFSGRGALVVTFPWQQGQLLGGADALARHLQRGGNVVLAWSGGSNETVEDTVLEELGLTLYEVRKAPLSPLAWRKFAGKEWDLREPAGKAAPLRVWAPRRMPELPKDPEVLYRTPGGQPAVVRLRRGRGSLWLLPVDALANARLGKAGNADLLETLRARLGGPWTFDEYHHGLAVVEGEEGASFRRILDLVLLHLAVLYVLAVLTLARRFGPPWRESPVVTGSVGAFLVGLGALHHRLRHHRDAARRLLERTRELSPDLILPDGLARQAETAGPDDLVALARTLARLRRKPAKPTGD